MIILINAGEALRECEDLAELVFSIVNNFIVKRDLT